jgi:hypothetical protein
MKIYLIIIIALLSISCNYGKSDIVLDNNHKKIDSLQLSVELNKKYTVFKAGLVELPLDNTFEISQHSQFLVKYYESFIYSLPLRNKQDLDNFGVMNNAIHSLDPYDVTKYDGSGGGTLYCSDVVGVYQKYLELYFFVR